jgi:hypothetical protein
MVSLELALKSRQPRLVLALVKRGRKLHARHHFDIKQLCHPASLPGLHKDLELFLEQPEDVKWVRPLLSKLNGCAAGLEELHASDMHSFSAFPAAVKCRVRAGDCVTAALEVAVQLGLLLSGFVQSGSERDSAVQRRKGVKCGED